jgi:hypothetical protein
MEAARREAGGFLIYQSADNPRPAIDAGIL